jgi:hypothetical protein
VIPKYIITSAISTGVGVATNFLQSKYGLPKSAASFIAGAVTGYFSDKVIKGDITIQSYVDYRWVTRYTSCYYSCLDMYYMGDSFIGSKFYSYTAEVLPYVD